MPDIVAISETKLEDKILREVVLTRGLQFLEMWQKNEKMWRHCNPGEGTTEGKKINA